MKTSDMDEKTKDYLLLCGIKSAWHSRSFSDFTNDEDALEAVKKYLKRYKQMLNLGVGLYLWGSNGTGKTHLLTSAFKELILDKGCKARMFTMDEIVDKFTSTWYSDTDKKEFNDLLRKTEFLGIDEFGKNVDKDGKPMYLPDLVKRAMESIIRFRVQMHRPIWFTSNTDPQFVKEVFSEDIASLLREAVVAVCVRGDDYRRKIQTRNKRELLK